MQVFLTGGDFSLSKTVACQWSNFISFVYNNTKAVY